ncbi:unnamed protein product, partial [Prunus brigantina]
QVVESEALTPKEGEGEEAPAPKECEGRRLRLLQKLRLRLRLGSSYERVITKNSGRSSESDLLAAAERELKMKEVAPKLIKKANKLYRKELALASFLLLIASVRSLLSAQGVHFYFLLFQGVTFLLVGLDLIGEQMS